MTASQAFLNAQVLRAFSLYGSDLNIAPLSGGKVNLSAQLSYTNTSYTDRKAVLQIRRDSTNPAAVDPGVSVIVSGTSDNATFRGVSGGVFQARDSAGITSGQRGILYGAQLQVVPAYARNNIGIDDACCLVLQHAGSDPTANATDCLYIGHNSVFTSDAREWLTGTTNAANCGYVFRATGAYFTGADYAGRLSDVSGNGYGVYVHPTIQANVTGNVYLFRTELNTAAASFTVAVLHHFSAQQVSIGAGSGLTVQIGFNVAAGLTGAATNYGFQSNLALSGTSRWNFYAAGTAPNLFAGSTIIGLGTIANSAVDGFLYLPSTASGAPTGTPTAFAGRIPITFDQTNSKLSAYLGGTWKSVTFT